MKSQILAGVVIAVTFAVAIGSARAKEAYYQLQRPDAAAEKAIAAILGTKLRSILDQPPRSGSEWDTPTVADIAIATWAKVGESERDYLFFAMRDECGTSNCEVRGYRNIGGRWQRVFVGFGGDGLEVLDKATAGHHDIVIFEEMNAARGVMHRFGWRNGQYKEILRRNIGKDPR